MKYYILALLLLSICSLGLAQKADSLKNELQKATQDTTRIRLYGELSFMFSTLPNQERIDLGLKGYELAKSIHDEKGQITCGLNAGFLLVELDYFKALPLLTEVKQICERRKDTTNLARALGFIAYSYNKFDSQRGIEHYRICLSLMQKGNISEAIVPIYTIMGYCFKDAGMLDSALLYLQKGYSSSLSGVSPILPYSYPKYYGDIYYKKGDKDLAMSYFRQSIAVDKYPNGGSYLGIARIFKDRNQLDSAKFYAKEALKIERKDNRPIYIIENAQLLYELYKDTDPNEALKYHVIASETKDSLFNQNKARQIEKLFFEEREHEAIAQRRAKAHQDDYENRLKLYALLGILLGLGMVTFILYRNNQHKQKVNAVLEKTLATLKNAQTQLIQSEKLASLGELTAGIAHEIQNPLNFVNNFSELSVDLVKDLKEEIEKPTQDKEYIGELFDDLSSNQEKINHHGKRASSIVKGMLEHSRASTGVRELTDINKLADEYLRLSYHGLRAKDKDFNADYKTDFDVHLRKIEVIPQDLGRVLLNLINNAFYAVNERKKLNYTEGVYQPVVTVSTQQADNQIIIKVRDNGTGMPESVKAKVFQPFFTTKPTGQGTGLGLSLAYDIVTKGHGGTLEVQSTEEVGTEFIIRLPASV